MPNRIRDYLPMLGNGLSILLGTLILAGLYAISRYDFLVFHCLTEAFSIVIAIAVFAIFWNTRQFFDNSVYLVVGLGCLFAGVLDLIYIFAYQGMSVFPGSDGNIALQAKTAAQWYVSLSCVCAFAFLRRKINQNLALFVYGTLLAFALASIFYWRVFPDCYLAGVGVTPFERIGLVISCAAYLGALVLLDRNRHEFDRSVFGLIAATLIAFFAEDFASAVATEMNGFARTVAHLCQVVALYFVYKAFVEVGLRKPYNLLFRSQQQSAEALERQQKFLQVVLDNVRSGIIACDVNGVPTLSNRAFREFHGLPPEGIPADKEAKLFDLYHPDGKTRLWMEDVPLFRACQGEHIHDVEIMVVPKAGPTRTFVVSGEPLIGKDGLNHGAVVAMHDITERKLAEEALRASEERYRRLFEAESDAIFLLDCPSGSIVDANAAALKLYGYSRQECLSLQASDLSAEPENTLRTIARGETHVPLRRHRKKDGTVFPVEIVGSQFDYQGRKVHVAAIRDITERVRAEETLRLSEERYRILVETIPELTWRASHGGLEVECNRRWYEYTGQTPAQVGYHGWLAAVHPDDLLRVTERILHASNHGEPYELEYRLRRASDGSYRWHLSRAVPLRGKDGRITDWFGCATDIEDLKQAQEILKLAQDEQLQRHQAELAHVARLSMMGELVASLAHELNQPLHAINSYACGSVRRVRKSSEEDAELVAALEQISKEAVRAAEVIRRVRAFVRKRKPYFSKVSVNHLIEEIAPFTKAELERRHARMVLDLAENLPAVIADPIQIEQVVMNLVRNGLEAMDETPDHSRVLGIKTGRHQGNMIRVEVRDRGQGIHEQDLERAFQPFFTTKPEGMGMGLAISRSIIRTHGGEIWATVNEDHGCSFHFTLPVAEKAY